MYKPALLFIMVCKINEKSVGYFLKGLSAVNKMNIYLLMAK